MKTCNEQFSLFNEHLHKQQIKVQRFSVLKRILQFLTASFIGSNELRIWQTYDRGNNWWHAYDPCTGCHTSVDSEAKMRAWIENRYYS